ncbi:MAG: Extracellular solute-binding protein family 3 [uncultured bacterium]|uniref:transporter substrate-binding domain-containing protein n=1 Tax=Cypionkella sp. TaxID=2811411 RepID=UPI000285A6E7|nr:transporter substrate-binding domain-containing protein [Cypionkella sp.]EKD60566.1 MAG: Extracellular solute-binding protein family 3 [uncultured bacterium]KAF0172896.1 MAG: polar amino acid transport system substrate-binding protein [Paracoccaceae bacterium]MDO8326166.1 transporter substrate-binding domain-containing protein [Cypionkella sp.]
MKKLLLASALLAFGAGLASAEVVRLATEGAYPPFNFIDDKGEIAGFEREFGDEICKRAALECTWTTNEWDSIIPNLQSGNYDVIIAGMSITEERGKIITFSENYYPPAASAYLAASADADVKGGVVSAQVSTIQAAYVAESGATLLEFPTPDETVAAVRNGEAVAVFADKDYLRPFADESNGALMFVGDDISIGGGVGLGMRQSDTELKAKMDAAIQAMKADGSLNTLIEKYFGAEGLKF